MGYFGIPERPRKKRIFINTDTDVTDPELGVGDQPMPVSVAPEVALNDYVSFLIRLVHEDGNRPSTFHASVTSAPGDIYGDVATVRFLARVAPAILLTNGEKEMRSKLAELVPPMPLTTQW